MIFLPSTVWSGRTELTSEQEMESSASARWQDPTFWSPTDGATFSTVSTHQQILKPIRKENIANNSHPLCDLDLKCKTQPNNLLISFANTYAESVFFI